ncbi:hypothetical protein H0I68_17135 [Yersinia kristensenii]|uniref:hypothetical protein n=1 Tax=Yersinia kristensenii TaxID=28152 RepID=UPI001C60F9F9|nr:hypothetical protein [Yersinia kristensenii]MBW5826767.1 hypothetical protein [Yersinia kristensenii]
MNLPTISKACLHRIEKIRNSIRSELEWQPSDEDVSKLIRYKTFFMAFFYQYALGAIVAGFAVQPLLKFTNPVDLFAAGLWLALTIVCAYRVMVVSSVSRFIKRRRLTFIMFFMLIISLVWAIILIPSAINASADHDEYCRNLQLLVERGIDSEKNSTIFNNMQCRIQPLSW